MVAEMAGLETVAGVALTPLTLVFELDEFDFGLDFFMIDFRAEGMG